MQNFKEMLIRQYIIGGFVQFFQDLNFFMLQNPSSLPRVEI